MKKIKYYIGEFIIGAISGLFGLSFLLMLNQYLRLNIVFDYRALSYWLLGIPLYLIISIGFLIFLKRLLLEFKQQKTEEKIEWTKQLLTF